MATGIPSAEDAEPAVRDMDAWAGAARRMAQRVNAETPEQPAGEDGDGAADGGPWQGPWTWRQGPRGGTSADGVWGTPGAGGGARDGEWGSCGAWWSHGSSWWERPH